ncbi:serine/threonine-protein kinase RsbW [Aneurinibacillus soli]|uniref:Serine-protein kinase RsbW n=1 Tax=Aneurinibacillus soli TaxID=1500254 RepID=A0A0U5B965_9BACL|nr:ATP-binding protein [Aneurinibacillus soli]PYE58041.1 serine/threonine-protein kinase RsbW [Aneurinibacillus soli]BAU29919.1 serine-protein kinase RsbW [Aneurinibacillus soli]
MNHTDVRKYTITKKLDICQVLDITGEVARSAGFTSKESLLLCLAAEEACTNAYEYITQNGQENFHMYWMIFPDRLVMEVTEPGDCFSITLRQETNDQSRGRGIQLILNIMDEVRLNFTKSSLSVVMEKRKVGIPI